MGLHSGEPVRHQDGYVGLDVHRAARIAAAAHGGQVVPSDATLLLAAARLPAGVSVRDLGLYRLKDLPAPERIFQLAAPGLAGQFPPLKSLGAATSFPVPATALVGREEEIELLRAVLAGPGARLVTLTGSGGIGKTRLAVQAAAGLPDEFPDGLWWVRLATVSRAEQVLGALAQVLGVREDKGAGLESTVAARLDGRRMLIVLDNAEHLPPELADVVVRLLAAGDPLVVLATSRERLQLSAERVYPVPPLSAADAVALLQERATAAGVRAEQSPVLARSWQDRALALSDMQDVTRQRLLSALAGFARMQGDYLTAQAASDEAASPAMALAGEMELFESLLARFRSARSKDDLRTAEALLTEALGVALAAGNGVGTSACRLGLVSVANRQGHHDEADDLLAENLPFVRGLGQIRCEGYTLGYVADTSVRRGHLPDCTAPALLGATRALQIGDKSLAAWCLDLFAVAVAAAGDQRRAAAILATTGAARQAMASSQTQTSRRSASR